jgi:diguanylate cyclase (GGDEF)-like protein
MDPLTQYLIVGVIFTLVGFVLGWYVGRDDKEQADEAPSGTTASKKADLMALVDEIRTTTDDQQEIWDDLRQLLTHEQQPTKTEIRAHKQANRCYGQLMKSYRDQIFLQDPEYRVVPRKLSMDVSQSERDAAGLTESLDRYEIEPQKTHVPVLLDRLSKLENSNESLHQELVEAREKIAQQTVWLELAECAALQDHLTELPNRRAFEQRLREVAAGHVRYGRPFSLLMLDLDHFKRLNDTYGHLAGDSVLRLAAKLMKETCRLSDHVARYGGEEFVIVATDTELAGACRLADRLCERMRNASLVYDDQTLTFTCSIGVAEADRVRTPEDLIAAADTALYAAKDAGRDTFRVAAPLVVASADSRQSVYAARPDGPSGP